MPPGMRVGVRSYHREPSSGAQHAGPRPRRVADRWSTTMAPWRRG